MAPKKTLVIAILAAAFAGSALLMPSVAPAATVPLCTSFNGDTFAMLLDALHSSGTGCILDDKTFKTFSETNLGSAIVTFTNTPFNPGLDLTNIGLSVTAGQTKSFSIGTTITVNPGGSLLDDLSLLGIGTKTGDSTLTGTGTLTSTTPGFKILSQTPKTDNPLVITFTPTDNLTGSASFTLTGNTGTESVTGASIRFSEVPVPEPASFTLMGTGLLGLAALLRRGRANPRV